MFSTIFIKSDMKILCFDVSCFIVLFIYTLQLRITSEHFVEIDSMENWTANLHM